jgi:hypothetical protein
MASAFNVKLKRLFRKHSRLLPYIGALIVFATFVVRDGLREHLKDEAASIRAANDVFAIREDNMETRLELRDLHNDIVNKNALNSFSDIGLLHTRAKQMYYSLGSVAYLIETTNDQEDIPRIKALDEELTKIRFGSLDLNISKSTVIALTMNAMTLESKMALFEDETLQHARVKLQRARELYDVWTWVSYVLYAIGWGLGLVGKVYGVDGVNAA